MVEEDLRIGFALRVIAQTGDTAAAQRILNENIHGVTAGQIKPFQRRILANKMTKAMANGVFIERRPNIRHIGRVARDNADQPPRRAKS